jgi:hypothetical protein
MRCDACGQACRVEPTQLQIHHNQGANGYWQWVAHSWCPPCRGAEIDYLLHGGTRPLRPSWRPLARPEPQLQELGELSDRELLDDMLDSASAPHASSLRA